MSAAESRRSICRPCPLCGAPARAPAFPFATEWKQRTFEYWACSDCGCTYVDPLPTDEEFRSMYSRSEYHDRHYSSTEPTASQRRSVATLRRHCGERRTLLDFGCGSGAYLVAARSAGFVPHGVEYEASAIATATRDTGLPVTSLADLAAARERFDVIHLGDVLEHLPDPRATLVQLRGLLAPNGAFLIEGPLQAHRSLVFHSARLFKSARRTLGVDRPGREPPTHLMMVDAAAQLRFFRDLGMRLLHLELYENGWPYRMKPLRLPRTMGELARAAIGEAAVALDATALGARIGLANRFWALLEPGPVVPT